MPQAPSQKIGEERKVNIRTMRSDIDTLLKTAKSSLVQILSAEAKKEVPRPGGIKTGEYRKFTIIGLVSLGLTAAGLISFWWFSTPVGPPVETHKKLIPMAPLFAIESSRTIEIKIQDRQQFLKLIADSLGEIERAGTIKRIIIKASDGPQERFVTVSDFFNFYRIQAPKTLVEQLTEEPMFFFYYGDSGVRFGMAAKSRDADRTLRDALLWEDTLGREIYPLLFTSDPPAENAFFEDRTYRNIDWRLAKLFPEKDLGIAYTVFPARNIFVLTTGKESMEVMINRLFDAR